MKPRSLTGLIRDAAWLEDRLHRRTLVKRASRVDHYNFRLAKGIHDFLKQLEQPEGRV